MEGFVEGPLFEIGRGVGQTFVLECEVVLLVDVRPDLLRIPFDGIDVEAAARVGNRNLCSLVCVDVVVVRLRMH